MADAAPVGQRIWLGLVCITACLLTTAVSIVALVPQSNEPATDLSLERLLTIGSHPPVPPGSSEGAVSVTLVPTMCSRWSRSGELTCVKQTFKVPIFRAPDSMAPTLVRQSSSAPV